MANDSGVPTPETADEAEDDGGIEIYGPPLFGPGAKVRANIDIRNDGTMPGVAVGDVIVTKGDIGYVRDIGTFLQRFYIYAVEFVDRGSIVGMRGRELVREAEQ